MCLPALVITGDFNHPDICWKSKATIAEIKQSRLLQCTDDNFLIQMPEGPTKGDALLNFMLYKELVRVVKVRDCLSCSKHKMVELRILRGESKTNSRIPNLNLGRADFGLLCLGKCCVMWSWKE